MVGKPPPSKAPYYCALYPELKRIAQEHGFALAVHGSMIHDFDLVAIPWVDKPSEPQTVVDAFLQRYAIQVIGDKPVRKQHNRLVYTLSLSWGDTYIDLSFMPVIK
jgi:hypothetical protein